MGRYEEIFEERGCGYGCCEAGESSGLFKRRIIGTALQYLALVQKHRQDKCVSERSSVMDSLLMIKLCIIPISVGWHIACVATRRAADLSYDIEPATAVPDE